MPAHRQRYAAPCRGGQALRIISNGRNWPLQAPAHGPAGRASGPRLRLDNAERLIEAFEDATADTHSVGDTQACAGSTVKDRCPTHQRSSTSRSISGKARRVVQVYRSRTGEGGGDADGRYGTTTGPRRTFAYDSHKGTSTKGVRAQRRIAHHGDLSLITLGWSSGPPPPSSWRRPPYGQYGPALSTSRNLEDTHAHRVH